MIRKAEMSDIAAIADTYTELLTYEQQNGGHSNWRLGVYPTIAVPEAKVPTGTMYVLEENGEICASMVLNHDQAEEYAGIVSTHSCVRMSKKPRISAKFSNKAAQ